MSPLIWPIVSPIGNLIEINHGDPMFTLWIISCSLSDNCFSKSSMILISFGLDCIRLYSLNSPFRRIQVIPTTILPCFTTFRPIPINCHVWHNEHIYCKQYSVQFTYCIKKISKLIQTR